MLKKVCVVVVLFSGLSLLSACSSITTVPVPGSDQLAKVGDFLVGDDGMFRDRQGEYLEAETIPRTRIPDTLDAYTIDDLLVIPEIQDSEGEAFLNVPRPRPPQSNNGRAVVMQRIGDRSWVVITAAPSQVWPRVRDFWRSNGIQLAYENPTRGLLDTGWLILANNDETKDKFRVIVEPGFQPSSTEIRVKHLAVPQDAQVFEQVNWPEQSTSLEQEKDILERISIYLADFSDLYRASSVSYLARGIPSKGKANITRTPAGQELLRLDTDFERSWAAVVSALSKAEVTINQRDVELGLIEVSYIDTEDETEEQGGIFNKVVKGLTRRKEDKQEYTMLIQLLESESAVEIIVQDSTQGVDEDEAEKAESELLKTIKDFLS